MPATGLQEFVAQAKNILSMRRTLGTIRASVQNWEMNVRSHSGWPKVSEGILLMLFLLANG